MKLFGKDLTPEKVMGYVAERLEARGLVKPANLDVPTAGVEPRVDPLSFYVSALEANADATKGLPLETHRDGLGGRAVLVAKKVFRAAGQVFINEALGRQRVFNGHVRDSYAQLAAEVLRLRQRVLELEAQAAARAPAPARAVELAAAAALSASSKARVPPTAATSKPSVASKRSRSTAEPVLAPPPLPRPTVPERVRAPRGQVAVPSTPARPAPTEKARPSSKPRSGRRGR